MHHFQFAIISVAILWDHDAWAWSSFCIINKTENKFK